MRSEEEEEKEKESIVLNPAELLNQAANDLRKEPRESPP